MVKLSDIELPMIFKNRLLFSHGIRNNWHILPTEVTKSLDATDWTDQKNRAIFLSHTERDAQRWVGRIANPYTKDGELYGDLEIHDADLALKLGPGKAPLGVSAEIKWPRQYADPTNFSYRSFAMVPNPEVPETMVNFSKDNTDEEFKSAKLNVPFKVSTTNFSEDNSGDFAKVTAMEKKRKDMSMSISEFYAVPRDVPSDSKLPIFDAAHVRNALSRFNETKFLNESEKKMAYKKIISAAKKFKINAKADFSGETEESNLMSAERGFEKKMENNANKVIPEEKKEVEETKVEETVEEVKEEAKADFSALEAKFDALLAKVDSLTESFAKFSESDKEEDDEKEDYEAEDKEEEPTEETIEDVKEAKADFSEEEVAEDVEEKPKEETTEVKDEEKEEAKEAKADFSELASKIDKLADAISKKEAAPMSTAEFGSDGNNNGSAVIDRLTNFLTN